MCPALVPFGPLYELAKPKPGFSQTDKSIPQAVPWWLEFVGTGNGYLCVAICPIREEFGNLTAQIEDLGNFSPTGLLSFASIGLQHSERVSRAFRPYDLGLPRIGSRWFDNSRQRDGLSPQYKRLSRMGI